jgi:3-keto-L-gulonate-6-phosphate decarboxylase
MEIRNKKNPFIDSIQADIKKYSAIAGLKGTEGGRILVESLAEDVIGSINLLCAAHERLTIQQFVAICAAMKSNKDLMDVLTNAQTNQNDAEAKLKEELLKTE